MTIDEAIETLDNLRQAEFGEPKTFNRDALKLGIEALKTIKAERMSYGFERHIRLTGETD